ncbi:MAG TPA: type II toxin-antitoxin system VapC family toxin [Methylocella sp.]|nr:type II toxin-antitoxin system VapC family toxin [Methylocella sp.]
MTTFLDSCVVIALLNDSDRLHEWSVKEVTKCKENGPAVICDIVYCEASVAMKTRDELDEAIAEWGLERIHLRDDALFRAGRAFMKYRTENKGPRLGVLPDFLIGATAEVHGAPLITDNKKDFIGYFPKVVLISQS